MAMFGVAFRAWRAPPGVNHSDEVHHTFVFVPKNVAAKDCWIASLIIKGAR
jgi:hypothetical protein